MGFGMDAGTSFIQEKRAPVAGIGRCSRSNTVRNTEMLASEMTRVRVLLVLNMLAVAAATAAGSVTWTWGAALIVVAMYAAFNCLGVIVTFHRYLCHHSFQFRFAWLEKLCVMIGALSGSGSPLGWVAIHQEHHRHSDTEGDPHAPKDGFWHVMSFNYAFRRGGFAVRRLWKDRFQRTLHNYYFAFIAVYVAALGLVGGVPAVILGFCAPSVVTMIAQGTTNYVAHLQSVGYKNYDIADDSKNVWLLSLINFGEGNHNNHHAEPTSYTTKRQWWEIDIAGAVIRVVGIPKEPKLA